MKKFLRTIIAIVTFLYFCVGGIVLGWLGYKKFRLDEDLVRELLFTKFVDLTLNDLLLIGHQLIAYAAIPVCVCVFGAVGVALMQAFLPEKT